MIVIDGFPMDLAFSEQFSLPGAVTQFPVEVGSDFSDHIRNLPEEINLECLASDSPIGEVATHQTRQEGGVLVPLPSNDAFHKLVEIRNATRPVTIETSFGTFDNMGLEDLQMTTDKDKQMSTGEGKPGGLYFTVKFKRMNLVTNKRTRVRTRTAMATGGKATAKAVDGFKATDRRMLWRLGDPPGAPLKFKRTVQVQGNVTRTVKLDAWEWAYVEAGNRVLTAQNKSNLDAINSLVGGGTGADFENEITYRFTGEASPGFALVAQHVTSTKKGQELTPEARTDFLVDRNRDVLERRAQGLRDLRSGSVPGFDPNARIDGGRAPIGKSISRFKRQAPSLPGGR